MTERLSHAERSRRRRLARTAVTYGVPTLVVILLGLVLTGVALDIGPFSIRALVPTAVQEPTPEADTGENTERRGKSARNTDGGLQTGHEGKQEDRPRAQASPAPRSGAGES